MQNDLNNNQEQKTYTTEEYIKSLHQLKALEFEAKGGWTGLVTDMIFFSLKWMSIGFSVAIGMNLVKWIGLFTI